MTQTKEKITYPLVSSSWAEEEIQAMQRVIHSKRFTMGENVKNFEKSFAEKFKVKHALMLNSGSSANLIAVASLIYNNQLHPGDEVIVPAISWVTTYTPLLQYGLKLRFLDVDLSTLNIDVTLLHKALSSKTRMIVAVNILGNPAPLQLLRRFANAYQLILFEDNCESMGATLEDKYTGTFGDVNTFSSFFSHHISTMEGGILTTDNENLYHIAKSLRAHGWTRDLPEDTKIFQKKAEDFYENYRFIFPGYNLRPLEFCGAAGIEQIKKLDKIIQMRRKNARLFVHLFKNDPRFIIQEENGKSSWFSFSIILNPSEKIDRKKVMQTLAKNNIEFRIITGGCFLRHEVIKYFDYEIVGEITQANIAHDYGFFVGNSHHDLEEQIYHLHRTLNVH